MKSLRRLYWRRYLRRWNKRHPYQPRHDAWWVIHSEVLQDALARAHAGEDPEILYVELIANSNTEDYRP